MRIGLIARADHTGLAVQTQAFFRNMQPEVTLVVNLSAYGHPFPDMAMYPGGELWDPKCGPGPDPDFYAPAWPDPIIDRFLERVDVVFTCETPYNYYLFTEAHRRGIKTVLQPNFEFFEYVEHDKFPEPTVFALPSLWHVDTINAHLPDRQVRYLPVPVDRALLPVHERTELRNILHTAGTVAQPHRNGTATLLQAMVFLQDLPIRATVFAQRDTIGVAPPPNVDLRIGTVQNYWDFYRGDYDLMVIPRRWGGLCLPMQEAMATGMPVMMPDCPPNNEILPASMLVPAYVGDHLQTRSMLDLYDVQPSDLAQQIRYLYDNPSAFAEVSRWALGWGIENSWDSLRDVYLEVLTP
jgi:glycosyltransferase involved in cell wall biosynthesis